MLDDRQPLTRSEWADGQLRQAILRGDYSPGQVLKISALEKELNVSATPLREALRNLATDGLVELHSHGSARVASIDTDEAAELYEIRLLLEPSALERSVSKGGDDYRIRVTEAWQALTGGSERSAALHSAFHRELLSACDSAWLSRVTLMLADRAGLMIAQGLALHQGEYDFGVNHKALFDLTMAGDGAGAADELTRHLRHSLDLLHILTLDRQS
jgi:DNA-binding GntR family transcriptional regulator